MKCRKCNHGVAPDKLQSACIMALCVIMYALAITWCLLGWGCNTVSGIGADLQAASAGTSRRFEKHAETMFE